MLMEIMLVVISKDQLILPSLGPVVSDVYPNENIAQVQGYHVLMWNGLKPSWFC